MIKLDTFVHFTAERKPKPFAVALVKDDFTPRNLSDFELKPKETFARLKEQQPESIFLSYLDKGNSTFALQLYRLLNIDEVNFHYDDEKIIFIRRFCERLYELEQLLQERHAIFAHEFNLNPDSSRIAWTELTSGSQEKLRQNSMWTSAVKRGLQDLETHATKRVPTSMLM